MDKAQLAKEIKSRVPLSSIVKTVVSLRGRGDSFIGLCPFHEEKTPSFHVRDRESRFKCFGCGASGDVIEFIMRLRGIGFNEALADLALKAGIDRASRNSKNVSRSPNIRNLLAVQKVAQEYFFAQLSKNQEPSGYLLKERGLSDKMIKQAGIGFGGVSSSQFLAYLKSRGVPLKLALDAGLLKQSQGALIPQFLSRITFPIRNFDGQIIAFGGRSFGHSADDGPKYVNTHSYAHYEKRKNFYGLFESKTSILKGVPPVLVEGYFDAMAIWALGMPALALCGTALSADHAAILQRLSARVSICFDRDSAGLLALKKSLVELLRKNINPNLIELLEKDPGDYLALHKLAELKTLVSAPTDGLCYVIEHAALRAKTTVSERVSQIDELMPIFASIKRPLVRRQYVAFLAKSLHEDSALLWLEIEKRIKSEKSKKPDNWVIPSARLLPMNSHERLLVEIILTDPSLYEDMAVILSECSEPVRTLLETIKIVAHNRSIEASLEDIKMAIHKTNRALWPLLEEVLLNRIHFSYEQAQQSLLALKTKVEGKPSLEALKTKRQEMHDLEKNGDFSSVLKNLKEQSAILMARKKKPSHIGPLAGKVAIENFSHAELKKPKDKISVIKVKDISNLDDTSFFDVGEDWL